jgi:hypothetical protein
MKIKNIKAKVAAKVAKGKKKVEEKCKGCKGGKCAPAVVLCCGVLAAVLSGCRMGEQPTAQRAQTSNTKVEFVVKDGGRANFTFGAEFVSLAQANETSGTESFANTPTSTPTVDVKPDVDVKYNDVMAGATATSKSVLDTLTDAGVAAVLKLMADKTSGTVSVTQKDGTPVVVKCEGGQCSICEDCTPTP